MRVPAFFEVTSPSSHRSTSQHRPEPEQPHPEERECKAAAGAPEQEPRSSCRRWRVPSSPSTRGLHHCPEAKIAQLEEQLDNETKWCPLATQHHLRASVCLSLMLFPLS